MTDFYSAKHYAKKAEKWATGTMAECPDGSAKHWAQVAEATAGSIGDPANRDLSNLTDVGLSRLSNLPLFVSFKTGHILNNASYVNGRLFSWLSGTVYTTAYNELVNELNAQKKAFYQFWTGTEPLFTLSYAPSVGDMAYTIQNGYAVEKSTIANINYAELGSVMEITLQDGSMGQREVGLTDVDQEAYIARSIAINDITVNYFLTDTNKKICMADQANNVAALYTAMGAADFYVLDTQNQQFKLPRQHARRLLRTYKNGANWYNLYSDGWCEQGGVKTFTTGETLNAQVVTLPMAFANMNYTVNGLRVENIDSLAYSYVKSKTTDSFILYGQGGGNNFNWTASGYADTSLLQDEFEYEYFFLGTSVNETSVDVGQIITALTAKADVDLNNVSSNIDYVVEAWQSDDGSMWYRRYKSGWLEQGGTQKVYTNQVLSFPAPFADTNYALVGLPIEMNANMGSNDMSYSTKTATSIKFILRFNGAAQSGFNCMWYASGKGA